ncbi:MAG TPA: polysaccharide deacetylase family protein [Pirellulales bacterium]
MPHRTASLETSNLRLYSPSSVLLTFLFHGVFADQHEIERNAVDPQQRITVEHFRQFVAHMLDCGYEFVLPNQVVAGLDADGRYVMATFDDGYASNALVRPVLEEFGVAALFYISTGHVLAKKSFWWDVVHREILRRGGTPDDAQKVGRGLKELTNPQIEDVIVRMFGAESIEPWGDIDRPFTPQELRAFVDSPLVEVGNHTRDHAILTNYTPAGVRQQLADAQDDLESMVGYRPTSVSYPNGNYSPDVLRVASELGFSLGITVERRKNLLPVDGANDGLLRLGRHILWGTRDIPEQCNAIRSDGWWKGAWAKFVNRDKRLWQRRSA